MEEILGICGIEVSLGKLFAKDIALLIARV